MQSANNSVILTLCKKITVAVYLSGYAKIMKREQLIALIACSVIFVTVLIIAVATATRSSSSDREKRPVQTATVTANESNVPSTNVLPETPVVIEQSQPEPPPQFNRYKRNSSNHISYGNFDRSSTGKLSKNLALYQFKAGILVDLDTRKVIWEKNSNSPVPIASLTKLLTIYTAFEELERRTELTLQTQATVSIECTQVGKVKVNLVPGEKVSLHELFIYSMLRSANDAAHLIAEYFGYGDSSTFINLMNRKAADIGMTGACFYNANGLPIYGKTPAETRMNLASCQDMVKLIERLYEYPMILRYASCRSKATRHGMLTNGNRLLGSVKGMEGLKTGYTNAAGHCLAFSCRRNGRRLAGVVTGFSKRQNCFDFTAKLLDWGFRRP